MAAPHPSAKPQRPSFSTEWAPSKQGTHIYYTRARDERPNQSSHNFTNNVHQFNAPQQQQQHRNQYWRPAFRGIDRIPRTIKPPFRIGTYTKSSRERNDEDDIYLANYDSPPRFNNNYRSNNFYNRPPTAMREYRGTSYGTPGCVNVNNYRFSNYNNSRPPWTRRRLNLNYPPRFEQTQHFNRNNRTISTSIKNSNAEYSVISTEQESDKITSDTLINETATKVIAHDESVKLDLDMVHGKTSTSKSNVDIDETDIICCVEVTSEPITSPDKTPPPNLLSQPAPETECANCSVVSKDCDSSNCDMEIRGNPPQLEITHTKPNSIEKMSKQNEQDRNKKINSKIKCTIDEKSEANKTANLWLNKNINIYDKLRSLNYSLNNMLAIRSTTESNENCGISTLKNINAEERVNNTYINSSQQTSEVTGFSISESIDTAMRDRRNIAENEIPNKDLEKSRTRKTDKSWNVYGSTAKVDENLRASKSKLELSKQQTSILIGIAGELAKQKHKSPVIHENENLATDKSASTGRRKCKEKDSQKHAAKKQSNTSAARDRNAKSDKIDDVPSVSSSQPKEAETALEPVKNKSTFKSKTRRNNKSEVNTTKSIMDLEDNKHSKLPSGKKRESKSSATTRHAAYKRINAEKKSRKQVHKNVKGDISTKRTKATKLDNSEKQSSEENATQFSFELLNERIIRQKTVPCHEYIRNPKKSNISKQKINEELKAKMKIIFDESSSDQESDNDNSGQMKEGPVLQSSKDSVQSKLRKLFNDSSSDEEEHEIQNNEQKKFLWLLNDYKNRKGGADETSNNTSYSNNTNVPPTLPLTMPALDNLFNNFNDDKIMPMPRIPTELDMKVYDRLFPTPNNDNSMTMIISGETCADKLVVEKIVNSSDTRAKSYKRSSDEGVNEICVSKKFKNVTLEDHAAGMLDEDALLNSETDEVSESMSDFDDTLLQSETESNEALNTRELRPEKNIEAGKTDENARRDLLKLQLTRRPDGLYTSVLQSEIHSNRQKIVLQSEHSKASNDCTLDRQESTVVTLTNTETSGQVIGSVSSVGNLNHIQKDNNDVAIPVIPSSVTNNDSFASLQINKDSNNQKQNEDAVEPAVESAAEQITNIANQTSETNCQTPPQVDTELNENITERDVSTNKSDSSNNQDTSQINGNSNLHSQNCTSDELVIKNEVNTIDRTERILQNKPAIVVFNQGCIKEDYRSSVQKDNRNENSNENTSNSSEMTFENNCGNNANLTRTNAGNLKEHVICSTLAGSESGRLWLSFDNSIENIANIKNIEAVLLNVITEQNLPQQQSDKNINTIPELFSEIAQNYSYFCSLLRILKSARFSSGDQETIIEIMKYHVESMLCTIEQADVNNFSFEKMLIHMDLAKPDLEGLHLYIFLNIFDIADRAMETEFGESFYNQTVDYFIHIQDTYPNQFARAVRFVKMSEAQCKEVYEQILAANKLYALNRYFPQPLEYSNNLSYPTDPLTCTPHYRMNQMTSPNQTCIPPPFQYTGSIGPTVQQYQGIQRYPVIPSNSQTQQFGNHQPTHPRNQWPSPGQPLMETIKRIQQRTRPNPYNQTKRQVVAGPVPQTTPVLSSSNINENNQIVLIPKERIPTILPSSHQTIYFNCDGETDVDDEVSLNDVLFNDEMDIVEKVDNSVIPISDEDDRDVKDFKLETFEKFESDETEHNRANGSPFVEMDIRPESGDSGYTSSNVQEPTLPPTITYYCICGNVADMMCACRSAIYCSRVCQAHWSEHKLVCPQQKR